MNNNTNFVNHNLNMMNSNINNNTRGNNSNENIYQNSPLSFVNNIEANNAYSNFNNSRNPQQSGIIAGHGFQQKILNSNNTGDPRYHNDNQPKNGVIISELSGQNVISEDFHDNMVPFIGRGVKQNTDPNANSALLERFTGNSSISRPKKMELPSFFDHRKNGGNFVNGAPSLTSHGFENRYYASKYKQGEKPFQDIKVGPALNAGFGTEGSGGLHQANTQEFARAGANRIINNRLVNNPKISYSTPLKPGFLSGGSRGLQATVKKNKPEKWYRNDPSRYFLTGGVIKAAKLREKVNAKATKRQNHKPYYGGIKQNTFLKPKKDPAVRKSRKNNFNADQPRNLHRKNAWTIDNDDESGIGDYGMKSIENKANEREITELRTHRLNLTSNIKKLITPITDLFRKTRKENFIGNIRPEGNMNSQMPSKLTIHDPEDIARTTLKEQLIHNEHEGVMNSQMPSKLTIHDPDDITRTTLKEQLIHNDHEGVMNSQMPSKLKIHDPNDITRTTLKEQLIHNDHEGVMKSQMPTKLTIYDPEDVTRTTLKEQLIHNEHEGVMKSQMPNKLTIYDPEDITKTTLKEQLIHNDHEGFIKGPDANKVWNPEDVARTTIKEQNIYNKSPYMNMKPQQPTSLKIYDPEDIARTTLKEITENNNHMGFMESVDYTKAGGYISTNVSMRNTHKQFTSDYYYAGHADGDVGKGSGKGYLTARYKAKNTDRQFLSDYEYSGIAGGNENKQKSYSASYNARLNPNKEIISRGRAPTQSKEKLGAGGDLINLQHKKLETDRINIREPSETSVYQAPPQKNSCGVTNSKQTLPEDIQRSRIDPELLNAHRQNPYTQSLQSTY